MTYVQDPVFQSFDPEEPSPMQDMLDLAQEGDIRAQYILGDLYSKGKGGLPKDMKKGAYWFDTAAMNGYYEALVRLAALAKRQKRPIAAYKWYTLAIEHLDFGPWRKHALVAREALKTDAKLTPADITLARKDANAWKIEMRKFREDKRKAEREKAAAKTQEKKKP